jgi:molecular chaperone HscB
MGGGGGQISQSIRPKHLQNSMLKCPSCNAAQEPRLICDKCGNPMPVPADFDYFRALGIPRKLVIDNAALEAMYHELGRKIHPDRFASSAPNLRAMSLSGTALLTRSYRTLRDPIARGLYWLELNGEKLAENNKNVPADLAATVFEVQEQLADFRTANGDASRELKKEIETRRGELQSTIDEAQGELERNFSKWDSSIITDGSAEKTALVGELKAILSKIAYLRTLLRDIDHCLETIKAA